MNTAEQEAVLFIALRAAFADGAKDERERAEIRRIAEAMGGGLNVAAVFQDALLGRRTLAEAAAALPSPELRQYAFEMAVGVCDADGAHSAAEKAFLDELRATLGLDAAKGEAYEAEAAAVAGAPLAAESAVEPPYAATMTGAEMDRMVLNYAILNGALELLPQNLASMAIIPLQMKMVYRIGKAHGFELDRGHVKDFLATVGVGLTSQYLEQFGRKLVGGLLGKLAGGLGRALGSAATGAGFSFASTYALGMVAKRYYAGGRALSADMLRQAFTDMLGEAKGLQSRYLPEIERRARTLDVAEVVRSVRA
ncbi:MAG: DUF533 domain-containing protein [Burkholderiales bacterium]|nr:DUF533 domain-containing protein [Burkholderiales bacterium]